METPVRLANALLVALAASSAFGCYDSTWGQAEKAQRRTAQHYTPQELSMPKPATPARRLAVHVWATPTFASQTLDWQAQARDAIDGANTVLEGYGLLLGVESMGSWTVEGGEDDLAVVLEKLKRQDAGAGNGFVLGFVGGLPRFTQSFHKLGWADVLGTHAVVRASTDLEEANAFEQALAELTLDERAHVVKERKRHRTIAVLLHEIGHTLGAVHETSGLMAPAYDWRETRFGDASSEVLRAAVAARVGSPDDTKKALLAVYEVPAIVLWMAPSGRPLGAVEAEGTLHHPVVAHAGGATLPLEQTANEDRPNIHLEFVRRADFGFGACGSSYFRAHFVPGVGEGALDDGPACP